MQASKVSTLVEKSCPGFAVQLRPRQETQPCGAKCRQLQEECIGCLEQEATQPGIDSPVGFCMSIVGWIQMTHCCHAWRPIACAVGARRETKSTGNSHIPVLLYAEPQLKQMAVPWLAIQHLGKASSMSWSTTI